MTGGSLIVRHIEYENKSDPPEYIAPAQFAIIQATYDFINTHLAHRLQQMNPSQLVLDRPQENWCLATEDRSILLVYALAGGEFRLDLRSGRKGVYQAQWFDPRNGELVPAAGVSDNVISSGDIVHFKAPGINDRALLLKRVTK